MKQPAKAPRGKSAPQRKTRAELNMEGRDRQRQKKQKGLTAGNRANPANDQGKGKGKGKDKALNDPRLGSKKPVPLVAEGAVAAKPVVKRREAAPALSAREELAALESNERLDTLLDQLENGVKLSAEEQTWLDTTLDRIEVLMEKLGIDLDEDSETQDPEAEEDMYRLLKGN